MGYSDTTNKQFKVYSPDLGYTSRSSRIIVDEKFKRGTVDLRSCNCAAGFQGTPNSLNDTERRGRPKKSIDPSETISQTLNVVALKSQSFQGIQDQPEKKATISNELGPKYQLTRGGGQENKETAPPVTVPMDLGLEEAPKNIETNITNNGSVKGRMV
ncbi:hypothetical protein K3495_g3212 [Podosphaera aphanis]|nr:hypothetical protein K3495_g3212 [Podosphaera aphanis]